MKRIYVLIAISLITYYTAPAQRHQVTYRAEAGGGAAAKPFWHHVEHPENRNILTLKSREKKTKSREKTLKR